MRKFITRVAIIVGWITFAFIAGCSAKVVVDPIKGWEDLGLQPLDRNASISADVHGYLAKLAPDDQSGASVNGLYRNATGQQAVQIEIAKNGTWWIHDLIYDTNNIRIRTVVYKNGHYRS